MQKVIVLIGLPGSGKSTWAKNYRRSNPNTAILSRDDFRSMIFNSVYSTENEYIVKETRNNTLSLLLEKGYDVIIDDTNLKIRNIEIINEIAKDYNVEYKLMNTDLQTCFGSNNYGRRVPIETMIEMVEDLKTIKEQLKDTYTIIERQPSELCPQLSSSSS